MPARSARHRSRVSEEKVEDVGDEGRLEERDVPRTDHLPELDGGAEFAEVAREHSDCSSSSQGGDLGSFGRGMMIGAFEDTAFTLEVGATSDVVETEFGFHIIHRTE